MRKTGVSIVASPNPVISVRAAAIKAARIGIKIFISTTEYYNLYDEKGEPALIM